MNAVIIVAGGRGLRMGGDVPKQFLPVGGKPILMRTIERFLQPGGQMQVVLVLPQSQQAYWHHLCAKHDFCVPCVVADGGATRFHSVRNGLALVSPRAVLVGVHDGVRPFVSPGTIRACYDAAARTGAAVPVTEVVETLRKIGPLPSSPKPPLPSPRGGGVAVRMGLPPSGGQEGGLEGGSSLTVPRSDYRLVQTPQVFSAALLRQAYAQPYTEFFTDDASVVERLGHPVTLVPGNRENIKITTPFDLLVAEGLCRQAPWAHTPV